MRRRKPAPSRTLRQLSEEEQALFRTAVADVTPLPQEPVPPSTLPPVPPRPRQRERDEQQVLHDMMSDEMGLEEVETGDELVFARPGLQLSVLRKLRKGQYAIEGELDLHGLRSDDARATLAAFLTHSTQRGRRCVRVIHGKGHGSFQKTPVLKNKVNLWLRQRDEVLAFCSARPVDGGTGAAYVLLRR